MKLLYVHNNADIYGASRSLLRLTSRLAKDGHEVTVVVPGTGPLVALLEEAGVRVKLHPGLPLLSKHVLGTLAGVFRYCWQLPRSVWLLRGLMRALRPDLVHTNTLVIITAGIAARTVGIPHIWHMRESLSRFRLWSVYEGVLHALSDRVIAVSNPLAEEFGPSMRRKKVTVIHNGFPREEFEPGLRTDDPLAGHGCERGGRVGVIGRISTVQKGQDVAVEAAAMLKPEFPGLGLFLIGSPYPGNEAQAAALDRLIESRRVAAMVHVLGEYPDPKTIYPWLDIVALPSKIAEGFPGVVIEAMGFGLPVVGTRAGGTMDQIVDGRTGYLVAPNDASGLAEALRKLLHDASLRARMGAAGRQRFLAEFEFEGAYKKILAVYSAVASARRKDASAGEKMMHRRADQEGAAGR